MTVHNSQRLVGYMNWKEQIEWFAWQPPQNKHTHTHLANERAIGPRIKCDLWRFFRLDLSHIRQQMYDFCHLTKTQNFVWHIINAIFRAWCLSKCVKDKNKKSLVEFPSFFFVVVVIFRLSQLSIRKESNWIETQGDPITRRWSA